MVFEALTPLELPDKLLGSDDGPACAELPDDPGFPDDPDFPDDAGLTQNSFFGMI